MANLIKFGSTSNLIRFTLKNKTTGQGLTGLSSSTTGLVISTICDNESAATAYTQAGGTIQTITTLGTYAAPSASNCRFKEVDNTNHKGLYEFQFADARFSVSSAKRLVISVNDAEATILDADYEIQLVQFDPYDSVHMGLTCLPNTAVTTNASLLTSGTGTDQLSVSAGKVLLQATQTGVTIPTVTTVTNQLTAAAIATGVWQDTTAGDFTVASSIGKSIMNGVALGTGLTIVSVSGSVGSVTGAVGSVTGNVGGNLVGTIGGYATGQDIATRRGTAQAGAAGSITLDSGASATDHLYERLQVAILSGTGAGQSGRIITGYVGSTKVATTTPNWTTNPDSTSVFALLPAAADIETILNVASIGAAGYVGIDWGHVNSPTTAVVLANSTIGLIGDLTATMKTSVQTAADAAITANTTIIEINADVDEIITTLGTPLTGAQIATAVWTDTTAGDFTTALSIGKSVMNGVSLGTGLTINSYTGNTPQTGDAFARLGAPAGASIAADLAEIEAETDGIASIPTNPFTGTLAQIATQVWTDTTSADFTVASSIGKSVMNGVALGTGLTINAYTGNTPQTGDVYAAITGATVEPTSPPSSTASILNKLLWLFCLGKNKRTQTATTELVRNDADAATIGTSTKSDDGTTFTRGKYS